MKKYKVIQSKFKFNKTLALNVIGLESQPLISHNYFE